MERIQSLLKKLGIENLVDDKLMKEFKINKFKKHSLVLGSGDSSEKEIIEKSKGLIRIKKYDLFKKHKQSLLG